MQEDLPIGTIRTYSRHGYSTWIVEEDTFTNVATLYPGEKMPWMMTRSACSFCGKLKTDLGRYGRVYSRLCDCLKCSAEHRKDGKNVYWRVLKVGRPSKDHSTLTLEKSLDLQTIDPKSRDFMKYDCPIYDPIHGFEGGIIREATEEERKYIKEHYKG